MNTWWDLIDRYYGFIAIVLNILLVVSGVWVHAVFPNPLKTTLAAVAMLIVGGVDYYVETSHKKRHSLRQHSVFIKNLLNAAASSVLHASGAPTKHVRACLMMPDKDDKLKIRYEYGFVGSDLDRHIEIPRGTGCCGQAWLHEKPMIGDLQEAPVGGMPEQWGLPPDQVLKIRKTLRSIFSVPVWAGRDDDYRIVAVLNIDSDNDVEQIGFRVQAIQEITFSFATVIGALIDEEAS